MKSTTVSFFVSSIIVGLISRYFYFTTAFTFDDAFIGFRIARNFASEFVLSFNAEEVIQSATSVLYVLILSAFFMIFDENAITLIRLFGLLIDTATVGLIFLVTARILSDNGHDNRTTIVCSFCSAVLYALFPSSNAAAVGGMETSLFCFTLALFYLSLTRKFILSGLKFCCVNSLVRPEGILTCFVYLGSQILILLRKYLRLERQNQKLAEQSKKLVHKIKKLRANAIQCSFLVIFAVLFSQLTLCLVYFGEGAFHTIFLKAEISKLITYSSNNKLTVLRNYFVNAPHFACLFLLGLLPLQNCRLAHLGILLWTVLFVVSISIFSVWWPWYVPPFLVGYSIIIGIGLAQLTTKVNHLFPFLMRNYSFLIIVCLVLLPVCFKSYATYSNLASEMSDNTHPITKKTERQVVGEWLSNNTSSDETVLLEGLGEIGFYSHNRFIDYPGLSSTKVYNLLKSNTVPLIWPDSAWALANKFEVDYVLLTNSENLKVGTLNTNYQLVHSCCKPLVTEEGPYYIFKRMN